MNGKSWIAGAARWVGAALPAGCRRCRGWLTVALAVALAAHAAAAPPQAAAARPGDALKAQMSELENSLPAGLLGMFPSRAFVMLGQPRSTYLEGFGVVVQAEFNLYPMAGLSPFNSRESLEAEMKREEEQKPVRLKALRTRLRELLLEQSVRLTELPDGDSVAIVIHLFNARPLPNIPNQVIVQAKREALLKLKAGGRAPEGAALAQAVSLREF